VTALSFGRRATVVALLVVAVAVAAVVVAVVVRGDGTDGTPGSAMNGEASAVAEGDAVVPDVHGPLCDALPAGDDPGGPQAIAGLDAAVALSWIPVLTIFEAGTRASGLSAELAAAHGVTILAPSDDAFLLALTQETLDELIISRQDELRGLLETHIVDDALTVRDLVAAGSVTTRSGHTLTVVAAGDEARLGDRATTVCSDYRVANATIHVIDGVLGELPAPAEPGQPASG
jgi:hypothetical protein